MIVGYFLCAGLESALPAGRRQCTGPPRRPPRPPGAAACMAACTPQPSAQAGISPPLPRLPGTGKQNVGALARSNAYLRRTDLISEFVGAFIFGWIYSKGGLLASMAFTAGENGCRRGAGAAQARCLGRRAGWRAVCGAAARAGPAGGAGSLHAHPCVLALPSPSPPAAADRPALLPLPCSPGHAGGAPAALLHQSHCHHGACRHAARPAGARRGLGAAAQLARLCGKRAAQVRGGGAAGGG